MGEHGQELLIVEQAIEEANALAVTPDMRATIIDVLRPIAERMPDHERIARELKVTSALEAAEAMDTVRQIKADIKAATAAPEPIISAVHQVHRNLTGFRGLFTKPNDEYARTITKKVRAYEAEEERIAEAERQRLQAIEDKKADDERKRLERNAARAVTPEAQERNEQAAQDVAPREVYAAPPLRQSGGRMVWKVAQIKLDEFLAAAAKDRVLQGYITIDRNRMARDKAPGPVPGVVFEHRRVG